MSEALDYFDRMAAEWDHNPLKLERVTVTANKVRALTLPNHRQLLDYGCGTGLLGLQLINEFDQVHLADASSEMLNVAKAKIVHDGMQHVSLHLAQDLDDVPVQPSVITMMMVLHHIHDVDAFFRQAYHKLGVGGVLIVADLCQEDGSFHKNLVNFDGHNGFDLAVITKQATQAGFQVTECEPYYDIWKANGSGAQVAYPLFMLVAEKTA